MSSFFIDFLALVVLVLVIYNFLLQRDKNNLAEYVVDLKKNVKQLKQKLAEQNSLPKSITETPIIPAIPSNENTEHNSLSNLLSETLKYIVTAYKQRFGHDINAAENFSSNKNNKEETSEHLVYLIANQSLSSQSADNVLLQTPENLWESLKEQLTILISTYNILTHDDFNHAIDEIKTTEAKKHQAEQAISSKKSNEEITKQEELSIARGVEIVKLQDQLQDSSDLISDLQNELANKKEGASYDDETIQRLAQGLSKVSETNKKYKLLIDLMKTDISTKDLKIDELSEELKSAYLTMDESFNKMVGLEAALVNQAENGIQTGNDSEEQNSNSYAVEISDDLNERIKALEEKGKSGLIKANIAAQEKS